MLSASTKRNTFRSLLALHFVGLALTIGGRIADFVIEQQTSRSSLQALALGRDLTGTINKGLGLPGFLIIALTGIAMTVLRYGRRPPIWVWIKIGLNLTVLFVASPLVAPALAGARRWAHWSAEHNQLAPQFQQNAGQAAFYGVIIFVLFLANIPVAVWKPFLSVKLPRLRTLARSEAQA